jgi:hypothetical protein
VDPDGKTNWTMVRGEAAAGVVAAGRRLHLHLQDGEAEAGGGEAVTLTAGCSFQRRATPCPAAALPAAILPTSPTPARTGDSHQGAARYACTETGSVRHSDVFHVQGEVHTIQVYLHSCSLMFETVTIFKTKCVGEQSRSTEVGSEAHCLGRFLAFFFEQKSERGCRFEGGVWFPANAHTSVTPPTTCMAGRSSGQEQTVRFCSTPG